MTLTDNISLAVNAIRGNLLRTILTFLIIAFGIMALVGILTAVDGIKASLSSNFATMGANNFDLRKKGTGIRIGQSGQKPKNYTAIELKQAMAFKEQYDYPAVVSVSTVADFGAVVKYRSESTNPIIQVMGADENYLNVGGFELEAGRNFTDYEIQNGIGVAILGNGIAGKLFGIPDKGPGKDILIGNQKYMVAGVLESKGSSSIFSSDNMVIIPLLKARTAYKAQGGTYVVTCKMDNTEQQDIAISEAVGLMRNIRQLKPGEEDDFEVSRSDKISEMLLDLSSYVTTTATIIGIITLLGGAIGLMNIMLVSVTERTREIGVSKALGAKNNTILTQFLVEAIVICQIGGLVGIILGIFAGNIVSVFLEGPFIIPWLWMALGILLCLIVGLVSGMYPAIKASKLDPIESLRYE